MLWHAVAHGGVRTPKESLQWKLTVGRNPLPHREIDPASAAWRSDVLTNWATSHPHFFFGLPAKSPSQRAKPGTKRSAIHAMATLDGACLASSLSLFSLSPVHAAAIQYCYLHYRSYYHYYNTNWLVSWWFEPSQPQRITSGLTTRTTQYYLIHTHVRMEHSPPTPPRTSNFVTTQPRRRKEEKPK